MQQFQNLEEPGSRIVLEALIDLTADPHVILSENPQISPRTFEVKVPSQANGRIIARLPETGAVVDSIDVKSIPDYSLILGGTQRIMDVFADGTKLVEFIFAFGGDRPDDFKVHLTPLSAGVLFEDGSLEQWVTADQLDELGRYKLRITAPADVPGNACINFQYFQLSQSISDRF